VAEKMAVTTIPSPRGLWRAVVPLLLGSVVALTPVPAQLTPNAWYYFALFVAVVAALITEPLPGPVVGLVAVTTAATLHLVAPTSTESIRWALTGFADSTVWLMLVVFMFALGYQATGLGRRIALTLVRRLGGRTLGLGYAIALADLALAPLTPSNTARSAGIVSPIIESIPPLYGSSPGETARRIGAYLMWTAFGTTCVTSSMSSSSYSSSATTCSRASRHTRPRSCRCSWHRWQPRPTYRSSRFRCFSARGWG
jgi:L-tartrate/succinate antiporter